MRAFASPPSAAGTALRPEGGVGERRAGPAEAGTFQGVTRTPPCPPCLEGKEVVRVGLGGLLGREVDMEVLVDNKHCGMQLRSRCTWGGRRGPALDGVLDRRVLELDRRRRAVARRRLRTPGGT